MLNDNSLPDFPSYVLETKNNLEFTKQFGDIIGKKLKKKLEPMANLKEKQLKYKQAPHNVGKRTLVLALDGLLLQT